MLSVTGCWVLPLYVALTHKGHDRQGFSSCCRRVAFADTAQEGLHMLSGCCRLTRGQAQPAGRMATPNCRLSYTGGASRAGAQQLLQARNLCRRADVLVDVGVRAEQLTRARLLPAPSPLVRPGAAILAALPWAPALALPWRALYAPGGAAPARTLPVARLQLPFPMRVTRAVAVQPR